MTQADERTAIIRTAAQTIWTTIWLIAVARIDTSGLGLSDTTVDVLGADLGTVVVPVIAALISAAQYWIVNLISKAAPAVQWMYGAPLQPTYLKGQ